MIIIKSVAVAWIPIPVVLIAYLKRKTLPGRIIRTAQLK
jgi:hypothetical protein